MCDSHGFRMSRGALFLPDRIAGVRADVSVMPWPRMSKWYSNCRWSVNFNSKRIKISWHDSTVLQLYGMSLLEYTYSPTGLFISNFTRLPIFTSLYSVNYSK